MSHHMRRLVFAFIVAATTAAWAAARAAIFAESEVTVPEAELREIIKGAAAKVQKALQDKPADRATPALVRIQAALMAASAQQGLSGAAGPQMASARDAALKLGASVQRRRLNVEQAKTQAEILAEFAGPKADPAASTQPVDLTRKFSLGTVMKIFDKTTKGGDGVEAELLTLEQQRRPYSASQMSDKLAGDAYKAVLVAQLAPHYQPEKNRNDRETWADLCKDMSANALELAQAVKQKDAKQVKAAVKKLNASCNQCHEKFR